MVQNCHCSDRSQKGKPCLTFRGPAKNYYALGFSLQGYDQESLKISIIQDVFYNEITVDGERKHYIRNKKPKNYRNVNFYIGSNYGYQAYAEVKNLIVSSRPGSQ